jgi:predicted phosphodiesterase
MDFSEFIFKAQAFLMALFMTLIPYKGISMPVMDTKEDNCLLNMELISDTHIEADYPFRSGFIKQGFKRMSKSKAPVDGVVICGDLTNYADEPSLAKFYDIIGEYCPGQAVVVAGNHDIGHAGDRDVTDISREEALANIVKYHNEFYGDNCESNYYAIDINGYKFIVIGDEVVDGGHWDAISMTQAQLDFLDEQLALGTAEGKPVFVCCHWPLDGINGEDIIWDGSGIAEDEYPVKAILEKYSNVFYISGHMHGGIRNEYVGEKYEMPLAEQVNGVTYISLPTYGIINQYGITWSGLGAQMEVYDSKVILRPINYLTGNWYVNSEYTFELAD